MRILTISIGLLAALHVSAVSANEIPRYDPERYCKRVADTTGGSAMIFNGCMDMEQDHYNTLKRTWASVPDRTKSYCKQVAQSTGGSYMILEGCIDMEMDEAESPRSFQF